jgi:serine/threonine protein kinase
MLAPNTLLQNRYLIIRSIGQGGMGAVYLARDERLGNTVALKETLFTDARLRKAFEREARLLARLRHPALPKVIDHFDEDDGQFLVMEFIAGDDIEVMLAQRGEPFEVARVLDWADQLLTALEYLHTQEQPIVHRDIKPANLKLTAYEQIILLDFGLAKGDVGKLTGVATSRSVFGFTPNFAPLEQIQGTGTDPRSDLYSLGATLYYLMTRVLPADALSRATATVSDLPDPLVPASEIDSRIPAAISDVLGSAVALNPSRRPASAAAMREALIQARRALNSASNRSATTVIPTPSQCSTFSIPEEPQVPPSPIPMPTVPTDPKVVEAPVQPTIVSREPPPPITRPQSPLVESPATPTSRLPWLVGGIIALLIVVIVGTVLVINNSSTNAQWNDTEQNRRADQTAGVAARVNGKPIMLSEVEKLVNQQLQGTHSELSPTQLKQARLQVLDTIIQREVLFQRAENEKLLPSDEEIEAQITKQKQTSGMTAEAFAKALKDQQMTMESLREQVRKDMAIERLQEKWTGKITISDREVEEYYTQNKDQLIKKRGVELAMITADPEINAGVQDDAKTNDEAALKINKIYEQLKTGGDFEAIARARSEDPSATNGGTVGVASEKELRENGFSADLIKQFFVMKVGDITTPVRFANGRWYIFKLNDRRLQDERIMLEGPGVRQQIAESLQNQKKEIANAELLTTAKNEAKVVNYLAAGKT